MKRISCKVYQDLLPLYVDGVVSDDTKEFINEHLAECEDCRGELEKMSRPLDVPVEKDASPFDAIKKQWARKNALIWGLSLALLAIFMLMALPVFDTAMQYHIQELIGSGTQNLLLLLPLVAIGFGLEWWFVHWKKRKWVSLILLVLPALILIWAEVSWAAGGLGDRIGGSILWYAGFPLLLGAGLAALIKAALDQPRWVKISLAILFASFILVSAILWPKNIDNTIGLQPDLTILSVYTDGETEHIAISEDALLQEIRFAKLSPCRSAPAWNNERCVLLRLNEEYILVAPHSETPYVYEYTGPLEEFSGQNVRYRIYNYNALYTNLKTAGSVIEE